MSNLEQRFTDTSPAYTEPRPFNSDPREQPGLQPRAVNTDPREQPQWPGGQPPYLPGQPQRRNGSLRWLGVSVVILLVIFGALASANLLLTRTITETKRFDVGSNPTLVLSNNNGSVHMGNGPTGQITVVARKRVFLGDNSQLPVHYNLSSDHSTLTITVDDSVAFGLFNFNQGVDFDVIVPDQASLNVQTSNGSLDASGITGQIKLDAGNGSIQATQLSGALTLKTSNGDITARQISAKGTSTFKTGNGSIDYKGTLDAANGSYLFTTGNGSIDLTLPGNAALQVVFEVGNGSIDSDFTFTGDGTAGNGPPYAQVTLHTGNGAVHLHRGN